MKQIKMKAKFTSTCKLCSKEVLEGSDVYYLPDEKKVKHLKCPSSPTGSTPAKSAGVSKIATKSPAPLVNKFKTTDPYFPKLPQNFDKLREVWLECDLLKYTDEQWLVILKAVRDDKPIF